MRRILLDIDGVLADFVGGTAALLGFDAALVDHWDYYGVTGYTEDEFWRRIDAAGDEFWANLSAYPWAEMLVRECKRKAPTALLTTPSKHHSSAAGKVTWMQRMFGAGFRDYLIGPRKEFCAGPGALLIDDSDANVDKFVSHGGRAILFPRPWNENRQLTDNPMSYVLDQLEAWAA